ncbi:hypothetical protein [Streptomyces pseudovenezuelae]|uniref:hypothetical protein n=1 Tax=Streptomyces pseudovenezuelae TaxID=67350 RepID=UPI002E360DC2|nr:hypothetical protein [Streptomyces pseudovenezuelae]
MEHDFMAVERAANEIRGITEGERLLPVMRGRSGPIAVEGSNRMRRRVSISCVDAGDLAPHLGAQLGTFECPDLANDFPERLLNGSLRERRRLLVSVRFADQTEALLRSHTTHCGEARRKSSVPLINAPSVSSAWFFRKTTGRFWVSPKERLEKRAVNSARAAAAASKP